MSRPGLKLGPPTWEASTLEKSHLDSLYSGFGTPTHDEAGTTTTTSTWLPQCRCIAHGVLSVEGMPEGDSKSASFNRTYCYPNSTDGHVWKSRRGHHYRETWPGSSLYSSRGLRAVMSRPGLEPGPPAWEASTLEKSHLDSLNAGFGTPTHDEAGTTITTSTPSY